VEIEDQQTLMRYLQPGESLLWVGRPPGRILFRKSDIFLVPFGLVWGGFAFFWEYSAYASGAPTLFLLIGGFFVVMGVHLTLGRFLVDMLQRRKTVYGLTTGRVLFLSGIFSQTLKSFDLKTITDVSLDEKADRCGTLTFGRPNSAGVFSNASWPGAAEVSSPAFEMIDNASDVLEMIRSIH
jgi:hypothetical protein